MAWMIALASLIVAACAATAGAVLARRERRRRLECEDRLELFSDLLRVGVFETDAEGRCLYANDLACRIAGLEVEAETGPPWREAWIDALHPDDRDRVLTEWGSSAAAGAPLRSEYRFRHPDGSTVWALGEIHARRGRGGRIESFVGAVTDVTDRKRIEAELEASRADLEARVAERTARLLEANQQLSREVAVRERMEQALTESERRLRAIVTYAPCWIYIKDLAGRYVFTSSPGVSGNEALAAKFHPGTTDFDLFPTEIAEAIAAHDASIAAAAGALHFDETIELDDGPHHMFSVKFPLLDDAGRVYAIGGISTDVTESRTLANELARRRDELAHVLRLQSMGEVVSEIAHELNQPLSAIVNFANGAVTRLRAHDLEPAAMLAVLGRISEQGLRAAKLIRRIRGFVRSESYDVGPVDLNSLIRDAAGIVAAADSGNPNIRLDLERSLPAIEGESVQLEQVIVNLIRNGLEAMAGTRRPELLVRTRALGDAVEIAVRDAGAGLTDEARTRMFEAFYSTKKGGLGMGLAISRSIVEAHGGSIEALANSERGTTFRVVLPIDGMGDAVALRNEIRRQHNAA